MKRRVTEINEIDMIEVNVDKPLITVRVTNLSTMIGATGHAKCDPSDRWDERFGIMLAQTRAVNRVTRKMEKYYIKRAGS